MKKNKAIFALLAGVLATALFAVPATAMAETTTIKQADFVAGVYTISESGDYALGESVEGHIDVNNSGANIEVSLDLGNNTLASDSLRAAITVDGAPTMQRTVTVKNGTIVQDAGTNAALRVSVLNSTVWLEDLDVTSTNHTCLDAEAGTLNVKSGTYKVTNDAEHNESVLRTGNYGVINVSGGTFTLDGGSNIVVKNGGDNRYGTNISGGSFSSFPSQAKIVSTYVLLKAKGGNYEVVESGSEKVEDADWKVTGVTSFGTVYFEDGDEAKAFAAEAEGRAAEQLRATITFDSDGGTPVVSQKVPVNHCADIPDDPVKEGFAFDYWAAPDGSPFNFYEAVTGDVNLKAIYAEPVASYKGVNYPSLQDAIGESYIESAGGTVTLLKDTTESVEVSFTIDLTIDLGGHTLTSASDTASAITLDFPATLTITNGTVRAADDCLYVTQDAAGSTVNLASDGDLSTGPLYFSKTESGEKEAGCIYAVGTQAATTTVNVMGGNYESAGTYAVRVEHTELNVTDGQFSNGQDENDSSTILASYGSRVEFAGERVSGHIYLEENSTARVHSGKFGDATNAADVVEGKYLFKGDEDYYEVVDLDDALEVANYVAYDYDEGTKVYFWSLEDAESYTDPLFEEGHDVAIVRLYTVTFLAWKNGSLEWCGERTLEDGQEVGELPDSSEIKVAGYTFAGWYVDGQKIDASYKVTKDVQAVAMWYKDGSETDPTDDPSDKGDETPSDDSKDKGKKLPQTGDAALAVSGIAAAGAALAGIGALRRRR